MMAFIHRIVANLKQGENLDLIVTIGLGFVIAALNSLGIASSNIVSSITLATLGLIAIGLLVTRYRLEDLYRLAQVQNTVQFQFHQPPSLAEAIASAEEIWMVGLLLRNTTADNFYYFKSNASQGTTIRALIVNLNEVNVEQVVKRFSRAATPEHFRVDFEHIINQYREIKEAASGVGDVRLRLLSFVPSFSLYIFPKAEGGGMAYVEVYCYKSPRGSVPKFFVTEREHPAWYRHFVQQFELMWNDAEPVNL